MPKYNRFYKYAYIDEDGIERIPKRFDEASDFACGLAAVKEDGKVVLPIRYEEIRTIDDERGIIDVKTNGRWGHVDFHGQWVTEPTYEDWFKMQKDKGNDDKEDDNN